MKRYLYLLSPLLILLSVSYALAQTLTADSPPPPAEALWQVFLKMLFPVVMTALSPYLTGLITSNFAKVPAPVQYVISSVLGLVMGAIAGQIPAFPLGSESAATIGLASAGTGQFLSNQSRESMHPKTLTAKAEIVKTGGSTLNT